jgi:hypothetical protein
VPALHDVQAAFAEAVTGGDAAGILPQITDDAPGAASRIAIYANHYRLTLIEALATTFPVTLQLVGDAFFRAAARHYVRSTPPVNPCLFEYGGSFPGFLGDMPEAAGLPYLRDVATLEWAINATRHAPDPPPKPRGWHAPARVALHPACRLVISDFAIDLIWQAHQDGGGPLTAIDVHAGPVRLLVGRLDDDAVGWICLATAEASFVEALIASGDLASSLAAARAVDPTFDLVFFLAALIEDGLAIAVPSHPDPEEEMPK